MEQGEGRDAGVGVEDISVQEIGPSFGAEVATRALIGVIVAEFFTAFAGLGYLIVTNANSFQTDRTFVPILVIAALGVLLTALLEFIERRVVRWSARD